MAPAPAQSNTQVDYEAITASVLRVLQHAIGSTKDSLMADINKNILDMSSSLASLNSIVRVQKSKMDVISPRLHDQASSSSFDDAMPPADSLQDFDPQNPWKSARYVPCSRGVLTIEGIRTRHVPGFENHPPDVELPFCYIRLRQEVSVREDRVPKETIIYPRERAQSSVLSYADYEECRLH